MLRCYARTIVATYTHNIRSYIGCSFKICFLVSIVSVQATSDLAHSFTTCIKVMSVGYNITAMQTHTSIVRAVVCNLYVLCCAVKTIAGSHNNQKTFPVSSFSSVIMHSSTFLCCCITIVMRIHGNFMIIKTNSLLIIITDFTTWVQKPCPNVPAMSTDQQVQRRRQPAKRHLSEGALGVARRLPQKVTSMSKSLQIIVPLVSYVMNVSKKGSLELDP